MSAPVKETKSLNFRMPIETWRILRQIAFDQHTSMNDLILKCVKKFEEKHRKKIDAA